MAEPIYCLDIDTGVWTDLKGGRKKMRKLQRGDTVITYDVHNKEYIVDQMLTTLHASENDTVDALFKQ